MLGSWVVYLIQAKDCRAVCTQDEWERRFAMKPNLYTLVRDRIATEAEAERLARGKSGDISHRSVKARRAEDEI